MFQRMVTGLQLARNNDAYMRFMTLTTSNDRVLNRKKRIRSLRESFQVLRQRIKRATKIKDGFNGFRFNRYYCLRTAEGNGVLHIIFWGEYIPQTWLSKNWLNIHGAHRADIRACYTKRRHVTGLVGYLLEKYLSDQKIERMSYGWRWAWLGFCRSWKNVKNTYGLLRKPSTDTKPVTERVPFVLRYKNHSVPAWRCTLWEPPKGSRQIKLGKFLL